MGRRTRSDDTFREDTDKALILDPSENTVYQGHLLLRPYVQDPDKYIGYLDETMLMWMEDSLRLKLKEMDETVRKYKSWEAQGLTYREVSARSGGDVSDLTYSAAKYTADEDLAFMYHEMGRISGWLFQSEFLRNNPEQTGA